MYICICKGITDSQIVQEIDKGASTMRELCQRLGVATQCGKCGQQAKQILQKSQGHCNIPGPCAN